MVFRHLVPSKSNALERAADADAPLGDCKLQILLSGSAPSFSTRTHCLILMLQSEMQFRDNGSEGESKWNIVCPSLNDASAQSICWLSIKRERGSNAQ